MFVDEYLSEDAMRALYRACDCYVMPSRGEGWGRPYMEAMACGLPTIGTNWGGSLAFMSPENSLLVECDIVGVPEAGWREVPTYKGHRWAEPRVPHLRDTMRRVYEDRDEAARIGAAGREYVLANFSREAVGPMIAAELDRIACQRQALALPRPSVSAVLSTDGPRLSGNVDDAVISVPATEVRVRWEGAIFRQHSLGHVNRELASGLVGSGVEVSLVPTEPDDFLPDGEARLETLAARCFASLSGPADVHVRHGFPPRLDKPAEGRFVLMQPWEYGYLPKDWVGPINERVDQVWCNSAYVRDVYRASGVDESKLQIVPLGVDPEMFRPDAPPYVFTDEPGALSQPSPGQGGQDGDRRPFVFLFVGGTLHRKGFDILLDAYLRAFSAYDDVVLVVKDTCTQTVYQGQNHRERLIELAGDSSRPRIVYVERDLSPHELAGIYTQADALVAPYRGEGFCLPALEAMACGLPVIVTAGGPTDDFVDEAVGWRLTAQRVPYGDGRIGPWECAGPTWMLEVGVEELARQLRSVAGQRDECGRRGAAAAERARSAWTWEQSTARVMERLEVLKASEPLGPNNGGPGFKSNGGHADSRPPRPNNGVPESESASALPPSVARQPTLSLCMIVKNEERVLGDCLQSIKPWVDEVIVVDTGSKDGTVAIAEDHGARVFHFPWTDSFSEARNESLRHATGDWLLWMDADDTIPEDCGRRLRDAIMLADDDVTGLMMQVHIPAAPGEHGFTVVDHVKLFRNGLGLQFEGRIHEQILEPIYRIGGEVRRTDLYVVHSGYDYSLEGQQKKRARDLLLLEKDLADRPDHPFVLFNIGMTAYHMKEYLKAMSALERCVAVSKPQESTMRKVYAMLAGCALEERDLIGARRWIEIGLEQFPRDPEMLFRAGVVYKEVGALDKAEEAYLRLLADREIGHIDSLDVTMTGFKAHHNLALIYSDMERWADAEAEFKKALVLEPGFEMSRLGLSDVYRRLGRPAEADGLAAEAS